MRHPLIEPVLLALPFVLIVLLLVGMFAFAEFIV